MPNSLPSGEAEADVDEGFVINFVPAEKQAIPVFINRVKVSVSPSRILVMAFYGCRDEFPATAFDLERFCCAVPNANWRCHESFCNC